MPLSVGKELLFVAAVWLNDEGRPPHLKLSVVSGSTSKAICQWAQANLEPGTRVRSDGLGWFAAVTEAGCVHVPTVVGDRLPRELPEFTWVNTVLGNLKSPWQGRATH